MDIKLIIKEIITSFHASANVDCIRRNIQLPTNIKKVITVIGVRRSGKTYLLFDTITKLINEGIPKSHILYINFEDERLLLNQEDLDFILQAYRELYPSVEDEDIWFFFDEIQNVTAWEKFIRRIYDTVSKNIYITGSNSNFLSIDIATSLRGRSINYEVYPFSFDEYLRYLNIDDNIHLPKNKALIINKYYDFLINGGFPETIEVELRLRNEILRNYFYVMLYKDLIERYSITSTNILKRYIEKIANNIGKPFSVNKIYNGFKSQSYKLDKNFLYEINGITEKIYLAFSISKFDYSAKKRDASLRKMYFIDNGLLNTLTMGYSEDYGKLLENYVYLYLRQNYSSIYEQNIFYHKGKQECDFIVYDNKKVVAAMQVSHSVSDEQTLNREIKGLTEAMELYKLNKGFIITSEQEYTINNDGSIIEIIPAYKLFLKSEISFS